MEWGRLGRLAVGLGMAAGVWAFAGPATASGDYSCGPTWSLDATDLNCGSSIVMSPGNDTRVNLALLLRDRGGLASRTGPYVELDWDFSYGKSFFDWGMFSSTFYPRTPWDEENSYYGSRCVSLRGGDAAFARAVGANGKLKPAERETLITARAQLKPICEQFGGDYFVQDGESRPQSRSSWLVDLESKQAREFSTYLVAAAAFYGENWSEARSGFASLSAASDPWVKETARYMVARVDLNAAQATAFDEWGSYDAEKANRAVASEAGKGFADYLKQYPKGAYAASAKGLQRRVMWLGGDLAGLSDAYETMLMATEPGSAEENELIQEIDYKLLPQHGAERAIDTPYLLATYDLMRMRARDPEGGYSEYGPQPIDEGELAGQEPFFRNHPELYQFLRATYRYYVAGDAQDVLLRIPDNSVTSGHSALDFSRQVLRGQALAAMKDPGEEVFWRRLIGGSGGVYQRQAAELGLALHWEKTGKLPMVFAAGSPIEDSMIRKILIEHSAGPDILRAEAKNAGRPQGERDLALFALLYKQLTHGAYAGFGGDIALVRAGADTEAGLWSLRRDDGVPLGLFTAGKFSDGYACPALKATVATLAKNAKDVKGRLCLGEFYRLNGFDDFYEFDVNEEEKGGLGSFANLFPGKETPRSAFYSSIIADPAAARADKAYALYRAVRCYAPSGYNSCGGDEVEESQRKAWFTTLKRQYADTRWGKELEYYW